MHFSGSHLTFLNVLSFKDVDYFTGHISKSPCEEKATDKKSLPDAWSWVSGDCVGIRVPVRNFRSPSRLIPNSFVTVLWGSSVHALKSNPDTPIFYKTSPLSQSHDLLSIFLIKCQIIRCSPWHSHWWDHYSFTSKLTGHTVI